MKYDVQSIHAVDYLEEARRQMALLESSWGQSAK